MNPSGAQDTIDLKAIFRKMMRMWWLFAITCTIAVAAGAAYIKTTPKSYKVKSVLRMSEGKRSSFGASKQEFIKGAGYLQSDAELEDEITMIRSVSNMTRTIQKLDFGISYYERKNFLDRELYDGNPFIIQLDSSSLQMCAIPVYVQVDTTTGTYRVRAKGKNITLYNLRKGELDEQFLSKVAVDRTFKIGEACDEPYLKFNLILPKGRQVHASSEYYFFVNSMDELLRQWQGATSVDPMSDESNIVILSSTGEVIDKQARFLNMLMDTYIDSEREKNNQKGKATIAFINEALQASGQNLQRASSEVQSANAGTTDASTQSGAINQELFRQQDQEGRTQSQLMSLQGLIATMSGDNGGTPNTVAASDINAPSLNTVIDKYNADVARLRSEELNVRIATAPIIALRRTVQTERDQIIQSAKVLVTQTQNELNSIRSRIGQLRGQLYALPGQAARSRMVMQSYTLTESIHNYLMEKSYEAQIAVNSDQIDKTVVDAARPESMAPIAPDKKTVLGGALLLGLLLPLLFILARDFFNDRISDLDELKRLSAVPILATIPSSKRKRITPDEPKSLLAESFRTARINLQFLNADAPRQVVGLTSSTSGEGKTFCSINLATVMALSGRRTLLIDADMRRPRVHEYLEMTEGAGLSTYLVGDTDLNGVIRHTDQPGLDVITAGPLPPNPLELMESPRLAELIASLRTRYDQIIVDASPMGLVSEFKILLGHLDVTLYVVRQGHTSRGMLRQLNDLHKAGKMPHTDLLFNDVKTADNDGYGYYTK
jgi:capsular exopolysaccharide synthesis family protein